jgi:hypothetical protein
MAAACNAWFAFILALAFFTYQLTDGGRVMTIPGMFDAEVSGKRGDSLNRVRREDNSTTVSVTTATTTSTPSDRSLAATTEWPDGSTSMPATTERTNRMPDNTETPTTEGFTTDVYKTTSEEPANGTSDDEDGNTTSGSSEPPTTSTEPATTNRSPTTTNIPKPSLISTDGRTTETSTETPMTTKVQSTESTSTSAQITSKSFPTTESITNETSVIIFNDPTNRTKKNVTSTKQTTTTEDTKVKSTIKGITSRKNTNGITVKTRHHDDDDEGSVYLPK